jgi:hypothetical protein
VQPGWRRTLVVHRHRDRLQPERRDQVDHVGPAGILHGDPVAGAQVGGEQPLDAVQRAAGDGDRVGRYALGSEPLAGDVHKGPDRTAVMVVDRRVVGDRAGQPAQVRAEGRQQPGVRLTL